LYNFGKRTRKKYLKQGFYHQIANRKNAKLQEEKRKKGIGCLKAWLQK
jgi:hypothetical protein